MSTILRLTFAASVCWAMAGAGGCSDGVGSGDGGGGQIDALPSGGAAGSGGTSVPAGSGGAALIDAAIDTGAAGGNALIDAAIDTGAAGGTTLIDAAIDTGAANDASTGIDAAAWLNVGVCAERGEASVDVSTFDGWEERYIISDSGFGSDAERPCVVRFALKRVGDAPHASACMDTLTKKCEWTHLVEYGNPQILADAAGACASSALALTSEAIAKIVGSREEVGFAKQYAGAHGSARLKYFEATQSWDVAGNASWDATTGKLTYTFRNGLCGY